VARPPGNEPNKTFLKEEHMAEQDIALMAHLMRRAGFGASRDEIEAKAAQGMIV